MSSINQYELLKKDGIWRDRLKYILSLSDKNDIEKHLKQSSLSSYDDLQMLIFLSLTTKNEKNLLEIFKTDSLPTQQRAIAGQHWIKLQKDEKQIHNFIVESINNKDIPRYLKHNILKNLHRVDCLKKSSSFFYDVACHLTESNNHTQYNINAHLVPFCKKDQIIDLLSRWSLKRLEQIDCSSAFYSKLIRYQPLIIIHLIKGDLNEIKNDYDKYTKYVQENQKLFDLLSKKEAKELICLIIEYLNQLEKHRRLIPEFISSKQEYFFKKVPNEMIQLITIVASNQAGKIKYATRWNSEGCDLGSFPLPHSFSIENYVRLFIALYDTCKWSSNNTMVTFEYLLKNRRDHLNLYSLKKEQKWLIDIIIEKHIGKEKFLEKFLKEGNENHFQLFEIYPQLTTPLSLHLISQYERNGIIDDKKRLSLIRYQLMTQEIFDQFLLLFKKTGSDVNQRQQNYSLFFQCAISTNEQYVKNVLQWIEKRFTNEQIIVIEYFLGQLSSSNMRFNLKFLPNNINSIQTIIDIAINHLQQSTNTLKIIISYGIFLLQSVENHQNKQEKEIIQKFATKIIKQCYTKVDGLTIYISSISESYPEARHLVADILISDLFPKLVSKSMLDELNNSLNSYLDQAWRLPQIDSFINSFFTKSLSSSTKLQSSFKIDTHSSMISLYLKQKSTRFERVNQLINNIHRIFFINKNVQRIILHSQQYRQFIDELIQDDKCLTIDKLSNEECKLAAALHSGTKNVKLPALDIELLNCCLHLLTGKQQEHITNIILNDYLQDKDVSNLNKLKSLRVLRHLSHTYNETLEWLHKKQDSSLVVKNSNENTRGRNRGANAQSLDDIILCLPATFDLTPEYLLKQFDLLKTNLNASNVKFISDAMLNISRKISDEIFLKSYLEFIRNEQFQKLGITANKEILRLLIQFVFNPSLIKTVIKPLWDSHPHQDVRACLILTLLHFIGKSNLNDDNIIIWQILEQAAYDDYLPVVQSLFAAHRGKSRWPLSQLKDSSNNIFETFVNQIQFMILDHPTSLEARSFAWSNIEYEYCHTSKLIEKAQHLFIQFDKNANTLWENAFEKVIACYKQQNISSLDIIIDIIKKVMSCREEIDSKENAIDNQHDLPVYHRIQKILKNLISHINQFDNEKKIHFRSLTSIVLQFDKTLAPLIGKLLIKIAQNKEDIEDVLKILQENLSENYFERILTELSTSISKEDSCPFIQQLDVDEKLNLAQWFIKERTRPLLVFDLLINHVFNQSGVDREQCRNLLRHLRQCENLYVQEQAMSYIVPWEKDGSINDNDRMSVSSESDDSNISE
ncbi:unnamed protein product [Rotaria sordida]|uniref:Uncharacterized protein n=1 Tax=Rotaria sordida TaxID=392033 RepID=A0A814VZW4_9BILA|nr:unnamed protein product [Rotaria sordida]